MPANNPCSYYVHMNKAGCLIGYYWSRSGTKYSDGEIWENSIPYIRDNSDDIGLITKVQINSLQSIRIKYENGIRDIVFYRYCRECGHSIAMKDRGMHVMRFIETLTRNRLAPNAQLVDENNEVIYKNAQSKSSKKKR